MALTKIRRHTLTCEDPKNKGKSPSWIGYSDCKCWISVIGTLRGVFIRETTATRADYRADELIVKPRRPAYG